MFFSHFFEQLHYQKWENDRKPPENVRNTKKPRKTGDFHHDFKPENMGIIGYHDRETTAIFSCLSSKAPHLWYGLKFWVEKKKEIGPFSFILFLFFLLFILYKCLTRAYSSVLKKNIFQKSYYKNNPHRIETRCFFFNFKETTPTHPLWNQHFWGWFCLQMTKDDHLWNGLRQMWLYLFPLPFPEPTILLFLWCVPPCYSKFPISFGYL